MEARDAQLIKNTATAMIDRILTFAAATDTPRVIKNSLLDQITALRTVERHCDYCIAELERRSAEREREHGAN